MYPVGSVAVDRVNGSDDMKRTLGDNFVNADTVLVKPNWYSPHPSNFTDAETLGYVLDSIDSKVVVIEGHSIDRQDRSMKFTVDGAQVNWAWLMKHPDWGWIKEEERWDELKGQEQWFLDHYGFTDVLEKHGATYINVTDEIWEGNVVDATKIRSDVESKYPPVHRNEVYGFMPTKLMEFKGSPLISLARMKGYGGEYPSLCLKNMFGLIPDPLRASWHGPKNKHLDDSIIDINKLYYTYFDMYGICEAIKTYTVIDPKGEHKVPWGNYRVKDGGGLVAHGEDLVELDAVVSAMIKVRPEKVGYLKKAKKMLGRYSKDSVKQAEEIATKLFPG